VGTLFVKDVTKKLNLWLFDAALVTVELQVKSGSCSQEVVNVAVMFLPRFAVDTNIICIADDTWTLLENLVHPDLEDVLAHQEFKWHSLEAVTTIW